jgi:hypothetical protein
MLLGEQNQNKCGERLRILLVIHIEYVTLCSDEDGLSSGLTALSKKLVTQYCPDVLCTRQSVTEKVQPTMLGNSFSLLTDQSVSLIC